MTCALVSGLSGVVDYERDLYAVVQVELGQTFAGTSLGLTNARRSGSITTLDLG